MEQWLDNAYVRIKELETTSRYAFISLSLNGREPLKIKARKEPEGQVLIAIGKNKYLTELEAHSYTYSPDISKALVFDSPQAARNMFKTYNLYFGDKFRFVKVENKFVPKDYRILAKTDAYQNGVYIKQLTSRSLYFTHNPDNALRFTESAAQKYIAKLGNRFRGVREYSIINVRKGETL